MTSNHGANKFEADSRNISPFTARIHEFPKHVSATLKFYEPKGWYDASSILMTSGAIVQNLVARANWRPWLVHPSFTL